MILHLTVSAPWQSESNVLTALFVVIGATLFWCAVVAPWHITGRTLLYLTKTHRKARTQGVTTIPSTVCTIVYIHSADQHQTGYRRCLSIPQPKKIYPNNPVDGLTLPVTIPRPSGAVEGDAEGDKARYDETLLSPAPMRSSRFVLLWSLGGWMTAAIMTLMICPLTLVILLAQKSRRRAEPNPADSHNGYSGHPGLSAHRSQPCYRLPAEIRCDRVVVHPAEKMAAGLAGRWRDRHSIRPLPSRLASLPSAAQLMAARFW